MERKHETKENKYIKMGENTVYKENILIYIKYTVFIFFLQLDINVGYVSYEIVSTEIYSVNGNIKS